MTGVAVVAVAASARSPERRSLADTASLSARASLASPAPIAWCGTDAISEDRKPDALGGRQTRVIYAFPSDGPDNFATRASQIASSINAVDTWWRGQDPTRTPRFDLAVMPGCATTFGALDIAHVQLPHDSAYYFGISTEANRIGKLRTDLAPVLTHLGKKYLVYYDGPVEFGICGEFNGASIRGGPFSLAVMYVQGPGCPGPLGAGSNNDRSAAHELLHSFGAVPVAAPHWCESHTCDRPDDIMHARNLGYALDEVLLDPGRDDYYGHAGSWEDAQDSEWLRHLDSPEYRLQIAVQGDGSVESEQPGIECPTGCAVSWDAGSAVRLFAHARDGSRFVNWTGACAGDSDCVVRMDEPLSVGAVFVRQIVVRVRIVRRGGRGSVETIAGVCSATCTIDVDEGSATRLVAVPRRGSRFAGWSGACRGRGACRFKASAAVAVTATFAKR